MLDLLDRVIDDDVNLSMDNSEEEIAKIQLFWHNVPKSLLTDEIINQINDTLCLRGVISDIVLEYNSSDAVDHVKEDCTVSSETELDREVIEKDADTSVIPEDNVHIDFAIGRGSGHVDCYKSFLLGTADYDFFSKYFRIGIDAYNYPFVTDPFNDCYVLCGDCLCFVEYNNDTNRLAIGKMFFDSNNDQRYNRRYFPDGSLMSSNGILTEKQYVISDLFSKIGDEYKIGISLETKNHKYWENLFIREDCFKLYEQFNGLVFKACDDFINLQHEDRYLTCDRKIYLSFSFGRLSYVTPYYDENMNYIGIAIGQKCTSIGIKPGGTGITLRVPEVNKFKVPFKGGGLK